MERQDADDSAYWDDVIESSDPDQRRHLVEDAAESVSEGEDGSFSAFYGAHDDWETAIQFSSVAGKVEARMPVENGAKRIRRRLLETDGLEFEEEAGTMGYTDYVTTVESPKEAFELLETVYTDVFGFPDSFKFKMDVKTLSSEDLESESGL